MRRTEQEEMDIGNYFFLAGKYPQRQPVSVESRVKSETSPAGWQCKQGRRI